MKSYIVYSPEYAVYPQTEIEPAEYGCDSIEILAVNARDAVMLVVKYLLEHRNRSWARFNRDDGRPPWAGYKAELSDPSEPPPPSSPAPPSEPG